MTPELIIPNVAAQPCMNGARRRKNASVRPDTNILAPAATLVAVRAIAATTNTKNANVKPDSRGMPLAVCVFATAPTGVRLTKIVRVWDINSKPAQNCQSNAHLTKIMFIASVVQ